MPATHSAPVGAAALVERILSEGPVGMSGIARLCGSYRAGKPTHPSTVCRWAKQGVRLTDGRTVRLEAVSLNGRLVSSRAAFVRFLAAQQSLPAEATAANVRSPAQRQRASEQAKKELERLGC